jgi:rhamnose utilization protein RhaD (predicted bifunctional aldolase and dehydrogenase)
MNRPAPKTPWSPPEEAADRLRDLCRVSRLYGADQAHVIAGGGNTSCKDAATLWVKASGTELGTIEPAGFVALDREALQRAIETDFGSEVDRREALYKDALMEARREPERGQRPSVEALMHHSIPGRYVVHTHTNLVNQLTCCERGPELIATLFGDRVTWIPYVDPGYILSKRIAEEMAARAESNASGAATIVIMQNHGMVIGADEPETIEATMNGLLAEIGAFVERQPALSAITQPTPPVPEEVGSLCVLLSEALTDGSGAGGKQPAIDHCYDAAVAAFLARPDARDLALGGPLTPDQIVYCKSFPLWLELPASADADGMKVLLDRQVDAYRGRYGHAPKIVLTPGAGVFAVAPDARGARIAQRVYVDAIKITLGAERLGGVRFFSERDRHFIDNWEVEQFRRQVAAQGGKQA